MRHLITDDMLGTAADALEGHGMASRTSTSCICGHKETPVRRHLAQIVADAVAPSLTQEVMAMLVEFMAQPAPAAEPVPDQGSTDPDSMPVTQSMNGEPVVARGRRFGFNSRGNRGAQSDTDG